MQILFMCTHNSCRSILSEAVFNHLAPAGMRAASAGSQPSGRVNERALRTLEAAGIATEGLSSKDSALFERNPPDFVVTVCDRAAAEACPVFLGLSTRVHWGLADPSAVVGSDAVIEAAFADTLAIIRRRVEAFLALPFDSLDGEALKARVAEIGRL
ncbi:arsenate reductase ArsC [Stutzerimonas azotifigens]|uniref:arsenate reductase ArsC n=1 Tax=Stutzerimonas azotifigens TaxID=291995 RepID=UPI00041D30B3|nr:arsenate reductase ArsC [Stutzerimonas azotifigens]